MARRQSVMISTVFNDDDSDDSDKGGPPVSARQAATHNLHKSLSMRVKSPAAGSGKLSPAAGAPSPSPSSLAPPPNEAAFGSFSFGASASPTPRGPMKCEEWTVGEVADWAVSTLKGDQGSPTAAPAEICDSVGEAIKKHFIKGTILVGMGPDEWRELIPKVGPRAKLLEALDSMKPATSTEASSGTSGGTAPPPPPLDLGESTTMFSEGTGGSSSRSSRSSSRNGGKSGRKVEEEMMGNTIGALQDRLKIGGVGDNYENVRWSMSKEISAFSSMPVIDSFHVPKTLQPKSRRLKERFKTRTFKLAFLLRVFFSLITLQDFIIGSLPVALVWVLVRFQVRTISHPAIFLSGIIFPLAFAVNAAYQRREQALQHIGTLKAMAFSLYICHATLGSIPCAKEELPDFVSTSFEFIMSLFNEFRDYLLLTNVQSEEKDQSGHKIMTALTDLSAHTDLLRLAGCPPPLITRPIHDLREVAVAFERVRVLSDYRTPSSIRSFIRIIVALVALMLCPYFSDIVQSYSAPVGYGGVFCCFLLLRMLVNTQSILENPFLTVDFPNRDDINMDYLRSLDSVGTNFSGLNLQELKNPLPQEPVRKLAQGHSLGISTTARSVKTVLESTRSTSRAQQSMRSRVLKKSNGSPNASDDPSTRV